MFGQKGSDTHVFGVSGGTGTNVGPTLIARGVKVEGNFSSEGDVAIEGEVQGTLTATGLHTIGTEAKIKADVKAGEAVIGGIVEGNIAIARELTVKSTARITGDIVCEVISVESGAFLSGKIAAGKRVSEANAAAVPKRAASSAPSTT